LTARTSSLAAPSWPAPHLDPLIAPLHNLAVAPLELRAAVAAHSLLEPLPPSPALHAAETGTAVDKVAPAADTAAVAVGTAVATATDTAVETGIPPSVVVVHNSAALVPELLPAPVVAVEVVGSGCGGGAAALLRTAGLRVHLPGWISSPIYLFSPADVLWLPT